MGIYGEKNEFPFFFSERYMDVKSVRGMLSKPVRVMDSVSSREKNESPFFQREEGVEEIVCGGIFDVQENWRVVSFYLMYLSRMETFEQ